MSRRIAFNVSDEVYAELEKMFDSEDTSINEVIKHFLYSTVNKPLEMSATEKRKLATIAKRKREIAEREARLSAEREVPTNPFQKKEQGAARSRAAEAPRNPGKPLPR